MYFEDFASLVHMDGHGVYVWSTYAIGLLIIAYNVISPLLARRRITGQIRRQVRSQEGSRRGSKGHDRRLKGQQTVSAETLKEAQAQSNTPQEVTKVG